MKAISIAKLNENLVNEDAAIAKDSLIAVSDGAGGGGVFADMWSRYLVDNLPDTPFVNFKAFDKWMDQIWEPFYNDCEEKAKTEGGMVLNKFYDEGSFATLVAVWKNGHWVSYGDSVAFCYNKKTGELQHSFGSIVDFNNPPYLVNCKDPTDKAGFKSGLFEITGDSLVFTASDALSHYIIMMYEIAHRNLYSSEIQNAIDAQTKDSNFIKTALVQKKIDFDKDVICKLLNSSKNSWNFKRHIESLRKKGLIAHDDYSIAFM